MSPRRSAHNCPHHPSLAEFTRSRFGIPHHIQQEKTAKETASLRWKVIATILSDPPLTHTISQCPSRTIPAFDTDAMK